MPAVAADGILPRDDMVRVGSPMTAQHGCLCVGFLPSVPHRVICKMIML